MTGFIEALLELLYKFNIIPRPTDPTPTVPPTVPPVPPTVPPPAPRAVTKDDDFRTLPTITKARMCEILRGYPMEQECGAIWEVMEGNPLPLAQSWLESNYGQTAHSQRNRNPLGLLHNLTTPNHPYEELVVNGARIRLLTFNTWRDAFKEWRRRMDDPNYSGGVYSQGASLEKYLCTYLAGPRCLSHNECGNGETQESCRRYLDETVARLNRYYGVTTTSPPPPPPSRTGTPYSVAGMTGTVILPFPLKQAIIPERQTNQRPGHFMRPDRYVQHDTGNRTRGANAVMHKNYLHNGAEGQQLSYHFTVDDKEAWQMIPVNEVAWHGGDSGGPCNYKGISCELCINADINEPKSRENAEILAAELMNALGITQLNKHQDCAGKYCPQDMLNDGYWSTFVQRVNSLRASRK